MSCKNEVSYFIPSGYDYREVFIPCGRTDVYGERAICEDCENDSVKLNEHRKVVEDSEADNVWLASAGWGEI